MPSLTLVVLKIRRMAYLDLCTPPGFMCTAGFQCLNKCMAGCSTYHRLPFSNGILGARDAPQPALNKLILHVHRAILARLNVELPAKHIMPKTIEVYSRGFLPAAAGG